MLAMVSIGLVSRSASSSGLHIFLLRFSVLTGASTFRVDTEILAASARPSSRITVHNEELRVPERRVISTASLFMLRFPFLKPV